MREYYVYIMASRSCVLYVGVTSDLVGRVVDHIEGATPGFTSKYKVTRLVYFETHRDARTAIGREKQIKGWRRSKKLALIDSMNPDWRDLALAIIEEASFSVWPPLGSLVARQSALLGMT